MTSAQLRLSRVTGAIAFVALAAAPAYAAGYLKIGDIKGESTDQAHAGQIEIQSWSWGTTQSGTHYGGGGGAGKANVQDISVTKAGGDPDRPVVTGSAPNPASQSREHDKRTTWVEREMKESGEKGGTEDINIGVGELQEVTISKQMDKSSPMLMQRLANPLPRGSLTTVVPAGMCRPGARYPSAELGSDGRTYMLQGLVVASCSPASSSSGDRPMEQISFNYTKVEVRGWNPKKKEE